MHRHGAKNQMAINEQQLRLQLEVMVDRDGGGC